MPLLRVAPPLLLRTVHRPQRLLERSALVVRRSPFMFLSGVVEPLLYLLSIRVGFGALVGDISYAGHGYDYATFVAPALMASSAMNGAVYDAMNIFYKLRQAHTYDALLATPLTPGDVAVGEIAFAVLRGLVYSAAFLVSLVALGLAESGWVVLALPACALVGLAFAAVGMAATTYLRSWDDMSLLLSATMPMFLFSSTFYPLSSYGGWAWVVQISPLYHGVALCRSASLGHWTVGTFGHVAVLLAVAAVGAVVAARRIEQLLLS